jgi:hypothetical protein
LANYRVTLLWHPFKSGVKWRRGERARELLQTHLPAARSCSLSVIKSADSGRNSVESDYASDVSLFNDDFSGRMRPTGAMPPLLPR